MRHAVSRATLSMLYCGCGFAVFTETPLSVQVEGYQRCIWERDTVEQNVLRCLGLDEACSHVRRKEMNRCEHM